MICFLFVVAMVSGCFRDVTPATASTVVASVENDCPVTGAPRMTLPDFPKDATLQYMSMNREGEWRGFRVMEDGRLFRTSREGEWEADTPLKEVQLAAVRAAVQSADLGAKPAAYGSDPPPDDAQGWALHARVETAVALSGLGCRPGFVDSLIAAVSPQLTPA